MPFYLFFLLSLAGTSNTKLNNCESRHHFLGPDLKGKTFSLYHEMWYYLWVFHRCFFSSWQIFLPSLVCWLFLLQKNVVLLPNDFLYLLRCLCVFLPYYDVLYWLIYCIDWLIDIEASLHSWDKSHLVMVFIAFNILTCLIC